MRLTNREIEQRIVGLEQVMDFTGYAGYAVATNYDRLTKAAAPYIEMRNEFFAKHEFGEPDENGFIKVKVDSPEYKDFMSTAGRVMDDVQEVELLTIGSDDIPKDITAKQLLSVYWMIKDTDNEQCS